LTPTTSGAHSDWEPCPTGSASEEGSQRGDHHPIEVGGQAGVPAVRHLFAQRWRMVVFGHSHSGLNHLLDHATGVGVMPILERALGL
jgi:hypothetical protein